jgi:DNA-binding NarL/FixJ family response regulator
VRRSRSWPIDPAGDDAPGPPGSGEAGSLPPASPAFELTALVCGEQPLFVKSLTRLLQEEAPVIRFAAAGSLEEGARLAGAVRPDAVVVTADVPGPPTADAIRFLRTTCCSARLLVLAPSSNEEHAREALRAGASGYLVREGDVRTLVRAIRLVCGGLAVIPAPLAESLAATPAPRADVVLSRTQQDLLIGIAYGDRNRQLAARLHMSERTVARRLQELYDMLAVAGRREAANHATARALLLQREAERAEARQLRGGSTREASQTGGFVRPFPS